jgi:hypothetical protein
MPAVKSNISETLQRLFTAMAKGMSPLPASGDRR